MKKKPITEAVEETPIVEENATVTEEKKNYIGTATVRVNVRAKADTDADIVKVLDAGNTIAVLENKVVKGFYPVEGGFIKKDFLNVKEA